MLQQVIKFYDALRNIFGICPLCNELFRVSDGKLYKKKKPNIDWKEQLDHEIDHLDALEVKILEKIAKGREAARISGRSTAQRLIRKLDHVFSPLQLNCDDCKVIFHPVDFVIFDGMKSLDECRVKQIVLLDKGNKKNQALLVQKSIAEAVRRKRCEWLTLRIEHDGNILEEQ